MLDPSDSNQEAASEVFTPIKSNLSRQAIANNAAARRKPALASEHTPLRPLPTDRPSYTTEFLNELKSATPSTPKDLTDEARALDLASKFGSDLALRSTDGLIPSATEIAEKKARRARLAKEQEYITLHPSDSDDEDNEIQLRPKEKYAETRLVRDDEDIAEGFEDFVDDGRVALGRKAEREQRYRERDAMKALIKEAEGGGEDEGDEGDSGGSDAERHAAYESAQTRAGMDGLARQREETQRPRTPPKMTPLPSLAGLTGKFMERIQMLKGMKEARVKGMEEARRGKEDVEVRREDIQGLLREAGEVYERLRREAGGVESMTGMNGQGLLGNGNAERGLESLGAEGVSVGSPNAHM